MLAEPGGCCSPAVPTHTLPPLFAPPSLQTRSSVPGRRCISYITSSKSIHLFPPDGWPCRLGCFLCSRVWNHYLLPMSRKYTTSTTSHLGPSSIFWCS